MHGTYHYQPFLSLVGEFCCFFLFHMQARRTSPEKWHPLSATTTTEKMQEPYSDRFPRRSAAIQSWLRLNFPKTLRHRDAWEGRAHGSLGLPLLRRAAQILLCWWCTNQLGSRNHEATFPGTVVHTQSLCFWTGVTCWNGTSLAYSYLAWLTFPVDRSLFYALQWQHHLVPPMAKPPGSTLLSLSLAFLSSNITEDKFPSQPKIFILNLLSEFQNCLEILNTWGRKCGNVLFQSNILQKFHHFQVNVLCL